MNEVRTVRRRVAISVGIICIILAACLIGAFLYYVPILGDKNNTISSLTADITSLQNHIQSDSFTINSLNSQIANIENLLASNNSAVASDNATIIALQTKIDALQNQTELLESQIIELSNNLTSVQTQYAQLNQTYESSFLFSNYDALTPWGMPSPDNAFRPQIYITFPPAFQEYANAILKICETALGDYGNIFHMYNNDFYDRPPAIHIFIYTNASQGSLSTIPEDYNIYLYVYSIKDMEPPNITGIHNVYGFIHELGHITFLTDNDEFNEGWAIYSAHYRVLPEVYSQLGDNVWPQPYNYSQTDGVSRFLDEVTNSSLASPGTSYAAAKTLYEIDQNYGPLVFKQAIDLCHPNPQGFYQYPVYGLSDFKNALVSVTNDTSLTQLFAENGF